MHRNERPELVSNAALGLEPLRLTDMPVPPCMEKAFGYRGSYRFVGFAKVGPGLVHWTDGLMDGLASVAIWDTFLNHPLIVPHFGAGGFRPRIAGPDELNMVPSSEEALRAELQKLGDAIFLDRKRRIVWIGFFSRVILHLTLAFALDLRISGDTHGDFVGNTGHGPVPVDETIQREVLDWLDSRLASTSRLC